MGLEDHDDMEEADGEHHKENGTKVYAWNEAKQPMTLLQIPVTLTIQRTRMSRRSVPNYFPVGSTILCADKLNYLF
jgi:hypothetical protein